MLGQARTRTPARTRTGHGWSRLSATSALASIAVLCGVAAAERAFAQDAGIFVPGSMAVSGFPGTTIPGIEYGLLPGTDPTDETFIDPEGAVLRVFDVSDLGGGAAGRLVATPMPFEVQARQIGQVFGLSYDDGLRDDTTAIVPSLYAAASSLFGIRIVTPDEDEDGRPERRRSGMAGAAFMEGQFGAELGGGPGSIWKIDGLTGEPVLFADIAANSGPGFGNIAFERRSRQLFASDLDTGLIHRIGIDGTVLDAFDHGVTARPAQGYEPVADDGATMEPESPAFDTADPATWGFTPDERRVWGLAVNGGRLYYAVGDEAEIWSVGIARDGTFADDARWELSVSSDTQGAVTDIAFDTRGFMYLARRGALQNSYDYTRLADTGAAGVLRYWRESPDDPATESIWVELPQEYAVGFAAPHRQAAGGIDLQYGYDRQGRLNRNACADTLAKTGDDLRNDPALSDALLPGGPLSVHGVQITGSTLIRPGNEPPFGSWFTDFDGFFEDPELTGHVGDVEIWRPCEGRAGYGEPMPGGGFQTPVWPPEFPPDDDLPPCLDVEAVDYWCTPGGLEADLHLRDVAGIGGDSLKSESLIPGIGISPFQQTRPPATPFTLGIAGHIPGEPVDVGLCFYRKADAEAGGYYPCCKVVVTLETPSASCAP